MSLQIKKDIVQSPLNYMGSKSKLLPQILPLFPSGINNFIDLFCGGCSVGLNVDKRQLFLNDSNLELINIFLAMQENSNSFKRAVINVIQRYGLSETYLNGYGFYQCDSAEGLAKANKKAYEELKTSFNHELMDDKTDKFQHYVKLFVLVVYGFNNQIRFNKRGLFNLPVGKRDFNRSIQKNSRFF